MSIKINGEPVDLENYEPGISENSSDLKSSKWEELGEEWLQENPDPRYQSSGGGGGGKNKSDKIRREREIKHSEEKRKEVSLNNIKKIVDKFPDFKDDRQRDEYLEIYTYWINASIKEYKNNEEIVLDKNDVSYRFTKSSGAGGQNVNKRNTAVICTHDFSNVNVRSEEERSQFRNRKTAFENLKVKLQEHVQDWIEYLGDKVLETKEVSEIYNTI